MDIFERTKQLAKDRNMTLTALAEKAELSPKAIYRWKTYTPRGASLEAVAKVLNVSVDYLLGNADEPNGHAGAEDKDLAKMLDSAVAFNGKPLTDHDKRIILSLLETMKADGEL